MENKKNILMKNNELVKARYHLTSVQSDIFIVMLYKLQKDDKRGMSCKIHRKDFLKLISSNDKKTIVGIKSILNSLMQETIFFKEIKDNGKNAIWGQYNLINGFEYDDETDEFTVSTTARVCDLLRSYLEVGYTPINMENYISLRNSYAKRMYDLLRLWSGTKTKITYTLDELKEMLMLENKYSKYSDFRRKVIEPSIKELNESKMFEITYKENKTGRKVTSLDFFVKDLDERTYFIENNGDTINDTTEKPQNLSGEFFIPGESIFTKGTLLLFKKDFGAYDFTEDYMQDAFWESAAALFERDDVEKIYNKGYNFFKTTLEDKRTALLAKKIRKEEEKELWRG
ncbi:MAG: replication initiation protein [Sarcina sp.]